MPYIYNLKKEKCCLSDSENMYLQADTLVLNTINKIMLINSDPEFINYLRNNAAWIIMDPHTNIKEYSSTAGSIHPDVIDIDIWNKSTLDSIVDYLPKVKNWCLVSYGGLSIDLRLSNVNNIFGTDFNPELDVFKNWMIEKQLKHVVYTGFHSQMCILKRPLGYNTIKNYYNCFIALDLCCPWPQPRLDLTKIRNQQFGSYHTRYFNAVTE